jgi:hypothetical protein
MLCDLVARKNNKLGILQTFWKSVHKKELRYTKLHGFQVRWASYGHNHDIVYSNDPILCTCVHLGMKNKVSLGIFNYLYTKNTFFIFLMLKMGFFCEAPTKNMFQKWTTTILNHIIPYFMDNSPFVCIEKVFYIPLKKLTKFCRFRWKRIKFELQVLHSLLKFFSKNHF